MQQRRIQLAALLAVVALAGCGGGPDTPSPTPEPSSVSTATAAPSAPPAAEAAPLSEAKAAKAFAEVAVPAGFRVDVQCPPKTAADKQICATPSDDAVVWSANRTYLGPELPGANGLPATVTINLTAAKTQAAADTLYERAGRGLRKRAGSYDIAAKNKAGSYTPGERGRGILRPRTSGSWRGTELNDEYVLVFDTATSKKLTSGTRLQRRGDYVLNVSWTAAKKTAVAELRDLPDRVATALDRTS